ncbi:MAG: ribbon-helix-helix protein, CopG family [Gammaproteobacteria bacterium]|nr:ribbon-helix-helix protein, CopG family [Gammaproteobacteria bacterium]
MTIQVSAKLPDRTVEALDVVARKLHLSRADIICQALETYLDDFDDLAVSIDRLCDQTDLIHDWDKVRHALLNSDDG